MSLQLVAGLQDETQALHELRGDASLAADLPAELQELVSPVRRQP